MPLIGQESFLRNGEMNLNGKNVRCVNALDRAGVISTTSMGRMMNSKKECVNALDRAGVISTAERRKRHGKNA